MNDQKKIKSDNLPKAHALRMKGLNGLKLNTEFGTSEEANPALTMEAWIKPAAFHKGIEAYAKSNFCGNEVTFLPGKYDDLTLFRCTEAPTKSNPQARTSIGSLSIPPGWRVLVFDDVGCRGQAYQFSSDVFDLAAHLSFITMSMLVIKEFQLKQDYAVIFSEDGYQGEAVTLSLRRYEDIASLNLTDNVINSVIILPGLELNLYSKTGCEGELLCIQGEVEQLAEMKLPNTVASLTVTAASQIIAPSGADEIEEGTNNVTFFSEVGFLGDKTIVSAGGAENEDAVITARSVIIPQGLRVTIFLEENPFKSITYQGGQSILPTDKQGYHVFVTKLVGNGDPCIMLETSSGWADLPLGRYEDLNSLNDPTNFLLRPNFGLRLFNEKGCKGQFTTITGGLNDEVNYQSIPESVKSIMVFTKATVLSSESDFELYLEQVPGPLSISPPEMQFCGARIKTDSWSHIARTYQNGELVSYLNGKEIAREPSSDESAIISGSWTLGGNYFGDIRQVSLSSKVDDPKKRAIRRFDPIPKTDPDLIVSWMLDSPGELDMYIDGGDSSKYFFDHAGWVEANPPVAPIKSAIGQKAFIEAKKLKNAQILEARNAGQKVVAIAQEKANALMEAAHARASAHSFELVHYINGGQIAQRSSKSLPFEFGKHPEEVWHIAFSGSGRLLLSGSMDGTLCLWDVITGKLIKTIKLHFITGIIFYWGQWLVARDDEDQWVLTKEGLTMENITKNVGDNLKSNRDGSVIISMCNDGNTINIQNIIGKVLYTIQTKEQGYGIAIDQVGKKIAVGGYGSKKVMVWDLASKSIIHEFKHDTSGRFFCVALDFEGKRLISGSSGIYGGDLMLWDLSTGKGTALVARSKDICFRDAAFHPDGQYVVSCGDDRIIRIWDLNSLKCVKEFPGHDYGIYQVRISPDGQYIASCSKDKSVRLWEWPNELKPNLSHPLPDHSTNNYFTDLSLDEDSKVVYAARGYPIGGIMKGDETLYESPEGPVFALALDSTHSQNDQKLIYWIENKGHLMRAQMDGKSDTPESLSHLVPGRENEWDLDVDAKNNKVYWCNGQEIWCGDLKEDKSFVNPRVIVPNSVSPHPIAIAVNYEEASIYWIDYELNTVRTANADGSNVRDLYETFNPKAGLAIDVGTKRLFWCGEQCEKIESVVVDDPGLFCWIQKKNRGEHSGQLIEAMQDTHLVGVKWKEVQSKHPLKALSFAKPKDHVDIGPVYLDCSHGFSLEFWLSAENNGTGQIFEMNNDVHGDKISLSLAPENKIIFSVRRNGGKIMSVTATLPSSQKNGDRDKPVWINVVTSLDKIGDGLIVIDGKEIEKGPMVIPRTCLMTENYIGGNKSTDQSYFAGEISMFKAWNRSLTQSEYEILKDNMDSMITSGTADNAVGPFPQYSRSLVEQKDIRPHLMTGRMDAIVPSVALYPLALDGGLCLQSKSAKRHVRLLTAHHDKEFAIRKAAADLAKARLEAQSKMEAAHLSNERDHEKADKKVTAANDDARNKRETAHIKLKDAKIHSSRQIEQAHMDAKRQKQAAENQATDIKNEAYRKAEVMKRKANSDLSNAQSNLANKKDELKRKS